MAYDPRRHHRRSIRLAGYDYRWAGLYYVTICTQHREQLFGVVDGDVMRPNDAGRMVQALWDALPVHYPGVTVDAFVVMPNHIHGIVVLAGAGIAGPGQVTLAGQPQGAAPTVDGPAGAPPTVDAPVDPAPRDAPVDAAPRDAPVGAAPRGRPTIGLSLGDVVQRFKTMTTRRYADGVRVAAWPSFAGRLWQRNYFEHIIRDDDALDRVRQYVLDNPLRWSSDPENPDAVAPAAEPAWR